MGKERDMKKKTLPSMHKIASWWASEQGQERIKQIKSDFNIDLSEKLGGIDADVAHCWACDKMIRSGVSSYKESSLGLHRCHVIPECLGGSDEPSNLVLMCQACHQDNPDSTDESLFWWWFAAEESDYIKKSKRLASLLPNQLTDQEADKILNVFLSTLKDSDAVPINGRLGLGFITANIAKIARNIETERPNKQNFNLEGY